MGASHSLALSSIDRALTSDRTLISIDDEYRDMLEEIEEQARETREAHARRREADRDRRSQLLDLRIGDLERGARRSNARDEELRETVSELTSNRYEHRIDDFREQAGELLESLRRALGSEDGEPSRGVLQRALDRAEELISTLEEITEAGERFEKFAEILDDILERLRAFRQRSGKPADETAESIARRLADELRAVASDLQGRSAGFAAIPGGRSGRGEADSSGRSSTPGALRPSGGRLVANREDGRPASGDHRESTGGAVRRLRGEGRGAGVDRDARSPAERREAAPLRPANAGLERGVAEDAVRASERLAERLKELADLLDGARTEEEESDGTGRHGGRIRESSGRNGAAERELVFDVRDRRTARNDWSRQQRRGDRSTGEGRAVETRESVDGYGGRPRSVHRAASSDVETDDYRGGSERGEGGVDRSGVRAQEGRSTTQRPNTDFQAFFDRAADRSGSTEGGRAGPAAAEGRSLRSGAASELARHLRETGNGEIVRQARVILRDNNLGELRLLLKPDGLGTVRMRMELEDKRVNMRIFVENSGVREVIRDNLGTLQRAFEADGFTTGEFRVDVEGDGSDDTSGRERASADGGAADSGSSAARGAAQLDSAVPMLVGHDDGEIHINLFV